MCVEVCYYFKVGSTEKYVLSPSEYFKMLWTMFEYADDLDVLSILHLIEKHGMFQLGPLPKEALLVNHLYRNSGHYSPDKGENHNCEIIIFRYNTTVDNIVKEIIVNATGNDE